MSVVLNTKHLSSFINEEEYKAIYPQVEAAHNQLEAKNGPGNDFLGWMYLPRDYDKEEFARIKEAAKKIREDSEVLVVAGIGGSYLGARAVIEAVKGLYHNELEDGPKIYFCGNSISPSYLNDIIALCKGKKFSINVISKSGTTTETSLAFRVLRKLLEDEMGVEEANKRIYATTDRAKGTLKQLADAQGWPTFVVPDDVGGRYSVLSAVGLLPIAAAGIRITVTGSLGDVMKESAQLAITYVRVHAEEYGIDPERLKKCDLHIHAPEGAVPKDGPSAGVTLTTALVSCLSGIPVRGDVAMTGEITLHGNVLPIGGLREKSMAAYREGMKTVLIPKDNVPDLYEVDDEVKKNLTFLPMSDLAQVLNAALLKPKSVSARHPHPAKKAKPVEAAIPPAPEKPKPGAVC